VQPTVSLRRSPWRRIVVSLLPDHSRRALLAAATALATAPVVAARKKKGKTKKKPARPLAFAAVTGTERIGQGDGTLLLRSRVDYFLPDPLAAGLIQVETEVAFATLQAELIAQVRDAVVEELSGQAIAVPANRVAVTVL
jgi:hypothetical protein